MAPFHSTECINDPWLWSETPHPLSRDKNKTLKHGKTQKLDEFFHLIKYKIYIIFGDFCKLTIKISKVLNILKNWPVLKIFLEAFELSDSEAGKTWENPRVIVKQFEILFLETDLNLGAI